MLQKNIVPLSHMIGYGFQHKNKVDRNQLRDEYREFLKEQQFYNEFKSVVGWFAQFGQSVMPFFIPYIMAGLFHRRDYRVPNYRTAENDMLIGRGIVGSSRKLFGKGIVGSSRKLFGKGMVGGSRKGAKWAPYAVGGAWLGLGAVPHLIDMYQSTFAPAIDMAQYL